jgi:hypothetical protein
VARRCLPSAAARRLPPATVARPARARTKRARPSAPSAGTPPTADRRARPAPRGRPAVHAHRTRPPSRRKARGKRFSPTGGAILHSREPASRDHLLAVALFVNWAEGKSAPEPGRGLDVSRETAFVTAREPREAMGADQGRAVARGHAGVDGACFGGRAKPANHKVARLEPVSWAARAGRTGSARPRARRAARERGRPRGRERAERFDDLPAPP